MNIWLDRVVLVTLWLLIMPMALLAILTAWFILFSITKLIFA